MIMHSILRDVEILDMSPNALIKANGIPVCDSKKVTKGCIFTCIAGEKQDGHEYISEAVKKGAAVIVTEREVAFDGAEYIRVPDTHYAYSAMWNSYCGYPTKDMSLIAVTGTNGKSSCVGIISQLLNGAGYKAEAIGTIGYDMTTPTPDILFPKLREMKKRKVECTAMEISSHAIAGKRVSPIRFDAGIFTNLTPEHRDFHKSTEEYYKVKSSLFNKCSLGVFCAENEYSYRCAKEHYRKKYTYGFNMGDYRAENIVSSYHGSDFDLATPTCKRRVHLPLIGKYQILNTLGCVCCLSQMGFEFEKTASQIPNLLPIDGRLEAIPHNKGNFKIFIDYAHTPDAMANAISSVRQIMKKEEKLTVIFGCGGDRDVEKRPEMGYIASKTADKVILTSDNPRSENEYSIIKDILSGWASLTVRIIIPSRTNAVSYAVQSAREGDVLLFLGKGHERYTEDAFGKHEYNEKSAIMEALSGI